MSHWITMVTPYGPMNGWLAEPDDRPVGGVVLVHEIFGVNTDMCRIAERYAEDGYLTVVPALFDKIQREVELDYEPAEYQLGNQLATQIGLQTAAVLVRTAASAIAHASKLAIIGYGWGGAVSLRAAQALSVPCVSYYDAWDPSWLDEQIQIPILCHLGEAAPRFSPETLQELCRKIPCAQMFTYPAGDAFDRRGDSKLYHAQSAELAFQRTRDFLRTHIRSENS